MRVSGVVRGLLSCGPLGHGQGPWGALGTPGALGSASLRTRVLLVQGEGCFFPEFLLILALLVLGSGVT